MTSPDPVGSEKPRDDERCVCGHTAHWHSHGGEGDCEHDGECKCPEFTFPAELCPACGRSFTDHSPGGDCPVPVVHQRAGEGEGLAAELRRFFIEGDQWHEDGPEYRLVNLLEALEVAPDTGDWHAEARSLFQRLLTARPDRKPLKPNRSASGQIAGLIALDSSQRAGEPQLSEPTVGSTGGKPTSVGQRAGEPTPDEVERLREALSELVRLKDQQDRIGPARSDRGGLRAVAHEITEVASAWQNARAALDAARQPKGER